MSNKTLFVSKAGDIWNASMNFISCRTYLKAVKLEYALSACFYHAHPGWTRKDKTGAPAPGRLTPMEETQAAPVALSFRPENALSQYRKLLKGLLYERQKMDISIP